MIARQLDSHIYKGAKDRYRALQNACTELAVDLKQVCYVSDSIRDIDALALVGLGLVPADASPVQTLAHRVLKHRGGNGAVAEAGVTAGVTRVANARR